MVALGEMGLYLLHKRGFVDYAIRSVGPAFGSALSWNYFVKHLIAIANSTNTVGAVDETRISLNGPGVSFSQPGYQRYLRVSFHTHASALRGLKLTPSPQ